MLRELEPEDPETERLLRNSFRWQWLNFALMLSILVLAFVRPHGHFFTKTTTLLLVAAFVGGAYVTSKIRDADVAVTSRYYRDVQSGRWRFSLMSMLILGLLGAQHLTQFSYSHDAMALAMDVALVLLPSVSLAIGPKAEIDEEIARILRGRALRVGYVSALLVLTAVTTVAVYRPVDLMTALAWGLFAASAVPVVVYMVFDWISDRGADG
jgi:hypothetical protein